MGREDIYESEYLEDAEVFADLANGVLFCGEEIINPKDLYEQDGELRIVVGNNVKKILRDKVKLWKGITIAIIAVENQTLVDYHMVIRNMIAESMAYDKQWKQLKAHHGKRGDLETGDEMISGMKKEEKLLPVITIVVYYGGEKAWDGAKTLYELLDMKDRKEKLLPFISNYKMNLFDYHDYDSFGQFHTEWEQIFEFLRYAEDKEILQERLNRNKERYDRMSRKAKILLAKVAKIKRPQEISETSFRKGDFEVCKAFEDMRLEGIMEGKMEGTQETLVKNIEAVMKNFHVSLENACIGLDSSVEEYEKAKQALV